MKSESSRHVHHLPDRNHRCLAACERAAVERLARGIGGFDEGRHHVPRRRSNHRFKIHEVCLQTSGQTSRVGQSQRGDEACCDHNGDGPVHERGIIRAGFAVR